MRFSAKKAVRWHFAQNEDFCFVQCAGYGAFSTIMIELGN